MAIPGGVLPLDLALGVALPVHSHIALNFVVSDYVPTKAAPAARAGLLGLTCLTLAGLFTLNTKGEDHTHGEAAVEGAGKGKGVGRSSEKRDRYF